jgi:glycosyltransferase involved in cell wall biosynthesis
MDTVVLAPAGYLLDPDIGSDYERPWRLAQGLAERGLRVVVVAREVKRAAELGPNVELAIPPGAMPTSPVGRVTDRAILYWHARAIVRGEVSARRALVVHHLGPCGEYSPSLNGRLPIPFVYGPVPGPRPLDLKDDEWLSWLRTPDATSRQLALSKVIVGPARGLAHILWKRTIRQSDAVTVEARANASSIQSDAVVIPPGIDAVQFSPGRPEDKVTGRVIAVGRLLERKGYDLLIRAIGDVVRNYSPAHLLLVGAGPAEQDLRRLTSQLGLDSSISFVGNVPRKDLPRLLNSAEVFCHPARWDNVPFAPLEAMACGLATLVSSAGGVPDTVGEAGLVHQAGEQEELTRHLSEILSKPGLLRSLGAAARRRVVERFTWQAMCDSYLELYWRLAVAKANDRSAGRAR